MSKSTLDDLRIERRPERPSSSTSRMTVFGLLIVFVVGAAFWWYSRPGILEVSTAIARQTGGASADRTVLNASGYVTARREATVSSKSTGKVLEVLFDEGMKVKEGQVLARLDDSNLKASLDVAQAQLESTRLLLNETRAQLKQADTAYQRDANLFKAQIESQSDLDKAESDAMTLRARVARQERDIIAAEKQVELWKQQIDDMTIRAPFDGVVTTKDAQPGEMISPVSAGGGFTRTGIGTIVDMNSLEIEIDVSESYINRVEPAQPIEAILDAYPDWPIPGKVIAIIPTADRQKATVKVRVSFDKLDPRILPDMAVKVAFHQAASTPAAATRSILIPKSAVQSRDRHDIIFIFDKNRAERRAVTVIDTQGEDAVLSAGVSAGEKVIVECPPSLKDGTEVKEKKP
jgi:HlyD family secretion protein